LIECPLEWTPAYASPLLIEELERIIRQIRMRWPKVRVLRQLSGMGALGTCSAAWAVVVEPAADDTVRLDLMRANRPTIGPLRGIAALMPRYAVRRIFPIGGGSHRKGVRSHPTWIF
jgi:hypothetical protein